MIEQKIKQEINMPKEIWLALPTKDVKKSKAFYQELGFKFHSRHDNNNDDAVCLAVGDNRFLVFLYPEDEFNTFINEDTNIRKGNEILLSIDAENRAEVDLLAEKALKAGGTVFSEPKEIQGGMYGCGFRP